MEYLGYNINQHDSAQPKISQGSQTAGTVANCCANSKAKHHPKLMKHFDTAETRFQKQQYLVHFQSRGVGVKRQREMVAFSVSLVESDSCRNVV